jgi:hypothetical protein
VSASSENLWDCPRPCEPVKFRGIWADAKRRAYRGSRSEHPSLSGWKMMTINVSHNVEIVLIAVALWATVVYAIVRITRH